MLAWKNHKSFSSLLHQARIARAQLRYFDHYGLRKSRYFIPVPTIKPGYQSKLSLLRNSRFGEPAVVVCNGPSLAQTPKDFIANHLSIGCNGIYKQFKSWGFSTDFLVYEDVEQFEIRAPDLDKVRGPVKMAAIYNAYALKSHRDWIFFNAPRRMLDGYYWDEGEIYPQFSRDFASIVHLGSTITYIMIQLAYHLGCDPVYIVGLDHSYGVLSELFPPGKILITKENYDLVRKCHVDPDYYKIGDVIGVPWVARQELGFAKALSVFESEGRKLFNASASTALKILPRYYI